MLAAVYVCVPPQAALAQSTVHWTTNYYTVTGATLPEIQRSLRENRPWKGRLTVDAMTTWHITWRAATARSGGSWRMSLFSTRTTIVIVLPRWEAPEGAPEAVREMWERYIGALARHEANHARIALAAAAEQQRRVRALGEETDQAALTRKINAAAQAVIEDYRRRDQEYDRVTRHGATEGAVLSGREPGRGGREPE